MACDFPFGIFWPLYCLFFYLWLVFPPLVSFGHCIVSFYLWLVITPLVSFGHCIVCPFIYGFWLPLWYLLAIVLSVLLFMASEYPFGIFKLVLQVINHAGKRWCLGGLWMDIKLQRGGGVDKAEKLCHVMSHLPLPSNSFKGPTCARCLTCNEYGILQTQGSHLHPILRVSCRKVADTPSIGFKSPLCVYPRSPPFSDKKIGHISLPCVPSFTYSNGHLSK
jgi:hypothetical protein